MEIIYGHAWNQIRIVDKNGDTNWYHYDLTNDPDLINDHSQCILESDKEFYKKYLPLEWEEVEKCTKSVPNKIIRNANLQRTLKEGTFNDLITSEQYVIEGQYSGKKVTKQDIKKILGCLTLSEMTYITDLLQQTRDLPEIEGESK